VSSPPTSEMTNNDMTKKEPFLFLFIGDEFDRKLKIEPLLAKLIPAEFRMTNLFRYDSSDLDWEHILMQAKTVSLLGGGQVFWISRANEIKETVWKPLENYCKSPVEGSYFIFESEESLPVKHPLMVLLKNGGICVNMKTAPTDIGLKALRDKLKNAGKQLTPDAWQLLEERLGGSKRLMDSCIDQLILYSDSDSIDERMVLALSTKFLRYGPFDLPEALIQRNTARALEIFHYFHDLSGDLPGTVGLLHWQLKRIWQAKQMLSKGASREEISKITKVPPFKMNAFLDQVKKFKLETVEQLIHELWRTDWATKTGLSDQLIGMEMFLAAVS